MNNAPKDLRFTKSHEWVRLGENGRVICGITDFAQEQLGDIVFVELPVIGAVKKTGDTLVVIESVKAVSDVFSPVAGKVAEINCELEDAPEKINEDPYGTWIFSLEPDDAGEYEKLMTADEYLAFLAEEAH